MFGNTYKYWILESPSSTGSKIQELANTFIDTTNASNEKNQDKEAVVCVKDTGQEGQHVVAGVFDVNYDCSKECVFFVPDCMEYFGVSQFHLLLVYSLSQKLKTKIFAYVGVYRTNVTN